MDINKSIQLAFEHYQAGNLKLAEHIFKKVLKVQPGNTDALHFLGVIYSRIGNYDLAIKYIKKILKFDPTNAYTYISLGDAFQEKGQLDEAITNYQKAIHLNPNLADAYNNLGLALQEKGQFDEAITCHQKAIHLNPNIADVHYNLGLALQEKGQLDEAITIYKKALQLNPDLVEAYNNLGKTFQEKEQFDNAITYFQKALQLDPNFVFSYNNLGTALQKKGQLDEAITNYQKAIHLNPNLADAYNNLGTALQDKGQIDNAITYFQKALQLNPNFSNAYNDLGYTLYEQGKQDKALAAYDMALFFKPDFIRAYVARCISHLPIIYPDHSSILVSRTRYHNELLKLRDNIYRNFSQYIDSAAREICSMQPFYLPYQGFNDRDLQQLYGNLVCQIMASRYPQFADCPLMPPLSSEEPLRVGVVSCFFYHHSNWKIPIKGWVENLDKERFSLYGYYTWRTKDKDTEAARQSFNRFIEDIYSFEDLCKIIREDNLHVIIYPEIGMDSITSQLAALRLAPVQCTSWGHPNTSGFPTIDYFLSSDLMEPPEAQDHYTEKLIRLPNLSIYYTPLDVPYVDVSRETLGLRPRSILYLCCQSLFKYLPQYDEIYPRIAQQVGDCQFLFISNFKSSWITEQTRSRFNRAFNKFNLNANEYVVFLPFLDSERYSSINRLADVYLDSIGWSGCNSTFEAIACDLPVVTIPGELMRGRHSSAILTIIELTETIAASLDEYVSLAVKLGQDLEWRQYISDKISKNKYLAYRDRTCIRALEDFLEREIKKRIAQS